MTDLPGTSYSAPAGEGSRVLVVEHEPEVAELQRLYLSREGFDVTVESDPARAAEAVAAIRPDAVLLDLTAPGVRSAGDHGAGLFQRVAGVARSAPVICLISDENDLQTDGDPGPEPPFAEHWIRRPFSPRLLVATVAEALRAESGHSDAPDVLRAGGVMLDPQDRSVRVRAGAGAGAGVGDRQVTLTATEFDLLAFLMRGPGRVYTREQLLEAVWGPATSAGARTVDVHVAQLRAKLGSASPLRTVRGVGYAVDE